MTKIVHIARPIAGVGVYVSLLAKHISSDFENVIICNQKEEIVNLKDNLGNDLKIYHSEIKREINLIKDFKCLVDILKILKEVKPNIIHCHSAKSGILGRLAGLLTNTKTIYTPHAYSYLSTKSSLKKKLYILIEYIFGFTSSITLACSKSEYNRAVKELKIKEDKVRVWNNSIENNIKTQKNKYLELLPKEFICSIGRPSYQKNTELLLEIINSIKKKHKNIHLVILGVGYYSPSLKKIKKLITDLNLQKNITLIPWLDREESLAVLEKSLLYVSTSRYEGLPYSVIEAIALSKPCILSNVDGNKDLVIENYNGFLVNENSQDFVSKILLLLEDEKLSLQMSNNSRTRFEQNFRIENNIKLVEKIYSSLLE